jgi:L-threonylcarbamoyladenylate synthase
VIDGGPCAIGIESTIVDLGGGDIVIRRPGAIGADLLASCTGQRIRLADSDHSVRVPGALASHYAPATPACLVTSGDPGGPSFPAGQDTFVLGFGVLPEGARGIPMPADPDAYAAVLYEHLREADSAGASRILIVAPPSCDAWRAVTDRLRRACRCTN